MTHRVEERTLEAIEQLRRFSASPAYIRDQVCAQAFGCSASDISWSSAVVMRSGFGTMRAWSALDGVLAFNPFLLRATVRCMARDTTGSLGSLSSLSEALLQGIVRDAVVGWEATQLSVFGKEIEVPLLNLDYFGIAKRRLQFSV